MTPHALAATGQRLSLSNGAGTQVTRVSVVPAMISLWRPRARSVPSADPLSQVAHAWVHSCGDERPGGRVYLVADSLLCLMPRAIAGHWAGQHIVHEPTWMESSAAALVPFATQTNEISEIRVRRAKEISEIRVRSGALIDKIEFYYRDGTRAAHGRNGGVSRPPFVLRAGEKLVKIETRQGDSLDGCQFVTDTGRSSQWYGGYGGRDVTYYASAQDPIIDIRRAPAHHGVCPRINRIVREREYLSAPGGREGAGCACVIQ
jgi:hypothetical protein